MTQNLTRRTRSGRRTAVDRFAFFASGSLLLVLLSACGNPRANPQPDNHQGPDHAGPVARPAVSLRPTHAAGEKFRTTRNLRVEELTETERYVTESEEVTLTEVLRADAGRLMAVRRTWELSETRLIKGYGRGETARGELDGCTLELTRRGGGVEAKIVAGNPAIRGANFLIEGFDTGLLPLDTVREGDYWVLEGSRLGGLNSLIEATGLTISKNKLTCQAAETDGTKARVTLDWRISGELQGKAAVLEFKGEFTFDRKAGMVTAFRLEGGRQSGEGAHRQIEIRINRRPVQGWLDLDR